MPHTDLSTNPNADHEPDAALRTLGKHGTDAVRQPVRRHRLTTRPA
jgi:hypothetical protein